MPLFAIIAELIESIIGTTTTFVRTFLIAPTFAYIRWLAAFIWIPEIIDITIYRDVLTKHWRIFPAVATVSVAISIPADYFAIKDGVWYFPGSIVGIWILG